MDVSHSWKCKCGRWMSSSERRCVCGLFRPVPPPPRTRPNGSISDAAHIIQLAMSVSSSGTSGTGQTGYTLPAQAGYTLPEQTGYTLPAQTGYTLPAQTGYTLPSQTGDTLPPPTIRLNTEDHMAQVYATMNGLGYTLNSSSGATGSTANTGNTGTTDSTSSRAPGA